VDVQLNHPTTREYAAAGKHARRGPLVEDVLENLDRLPFSEQSFEYFTFDRLRLANA
jgi:hypothetical protein